MDVVLTRYGKWWKRKQDSLHKFPGRLLHTQLDGLDSPAGYPEAVEHAQIVMEETQIVLKEHPRLRSLARLERECKEWLQVFESRMSIDGIPIEEAVDAVVFSTAPLERVLRWLK